MFSMFATLFNSLTILFGAAEKGATALSNVADVAVDTSEHYRDSRRAEMAKELKLLESQ